MTTKTYRTRELKGYSIHIFVGDSEVRTPICFKSGCTLGSTATYTTSNPEIQKALESLKSFGDTFFIEKVVSTEEEMSAATPDVTTEPAKEEEIEVVDMLDAQTFKNLVELRNALKDKGVDVSQITNVKMAENIAKKNGYNYTIEKNA
jgi:hypothetical protein